MQQYWNSSRDLHMVHLVGKQQKSYKLVQTSESASPQLDYPCFFATAFLAELHHAHTPCSQHVDSQNQH